MDGKAKIRCVEQDCDFEVEGAFSIINENRIAGPLRSILIKHHVDTRQVYLYGLMYGHKLYKVLFEDKEKEIPVIINVEGYIGQIGITQEEREHLGSLSETPINKERK